MAPDGSAAAAFAETLRAVFPYFALVALWLAWRRGRPDGFLFVLLLAQTWIWTASNAPLGRIYALGTSSDRAGNLQLVQVVAAGNPWPESAQVGQYSFEPGWGLLAALVSGFDPDRVLVLYPWFSLATAGLFVLSIAVGLGRATGDPWAGVLAAAFASLLASSPTDFSEHYRDPWAILFLLKPNHAIGLVLAPLLFWGMARLTTIREAALVGALLGLLGWLCVFHMVFIWTGLFVLVAWARVLRPGCPERGRWVLFVIVLVVSCLATVPYLYVLLFQFPAGEPGPRFGLPPAEAYALWTTTQSGVLLPFAAAGILWLRRRDEPLYRQWAAALVGALLFWWLLFGLGLFNRARERDEVFYWIRFLTAALAGTGAWGATQSLLAQLPSWTRRSETRAAVLLAALVPYWQPAWWQPARMDDYFLPSVAPLPAILVKPGEYLRHYTAPADVMAGDPLYMKYVGALGARRALYSSNLNPTRQQREHLETLNEAIVRGGDPSLLGEAQSLGVRHIVLTRGYVGRLGLTLQSFQQRQDLVLRHLSRDDDGDYVAIFEIHPSEAEGP